MLTMQPADSQKIRNFELPVRFFGWRGGQDAKSCRDLTPYPLHMLAAALVSWVVSAHRREAAHDCAAIDAAVRGAGDCDHTAYVALATDVANRLHCTSA